ncbi:mediator of RNA polymerase II transcription subunit 26-like isoform X2 [Ostrinia furnacalis]|nr:mediator of RNA polymerase II transcription subunit 26-like isoform X2 [Ostrinia furnacalis]XP_028177633.1 mediator of RNA polymerase II transcription subunit 26-like isoform X2 [Ostrinia furnacalis]XP_028177634.1 mediator of RNA polymerase II transcription subunit 26-like isoform X2 [Ostrinia furnacalis]
MQAVNEIISILEKFNITKELLETTRLGKHVNELRRKTTDPTLARRAKVLVKRWRDLVIPTVASPGHTGSNRSSAERQMRRLGGTPLTSPALSRVVSPAVNSPRPPSRPAWGGYESDSQDVILVDDDPPPAPLLAPPTSLAPPTTPHKPLTPPVKRPTSPVGLHDEKKAKRDKKPKRRRGHSRAGSGTEAPGAPPAPAPPSPAPAASAPGGPWGARNGASERRRNGYRRDKLDPYAALVNKLPPAGAKKVSILLSFYFNKAPGGQRGVRAPPQRVQTRQAGPVRGARQQAAAGWG